MLVVNYFCDSGDEWGGPLSADADGDKLYSFQPPEPASTQLWMT